MREPAVVSGSLLKPAWAPEPGVVGCVPPGVWTGQRASQPTLGWGRALGVGRCVPQLHLLLGTTCARVELDFLLMKADYRVAATRCSNALQAASKALGNNLPSFAGLSRGGATVSECQGCLCPRGALEEQSHREERTHLEWQRHFRKGLIWIHLRECGKLIKKTKSPALHSSEPVAAAVWAGLPGSVGLWEWMEQGSPRGSWSQVAVTAMLGRWHWGSG